MTTTARSSFHALRRATPRRPRAEWSRDYVMARYPRLVAHLICESLGYFTPRSAANAICHYAADQPFFCEWYYAAAGAERQHFERDELIERLKNVNKSVVQAAFQRHHTHSGYMAEYKQAKAIVDRELEIGRSPSLASWF